MNRTLAVADSGRGFQFFGAADVSLVGKRFHVNGQRATAIGFDRLALLVRTVENAEWRPDIVARKRDDAQWVCEQAALHEAILDRAMSRGSVVPARFLSIFEQYSDLEALVRSNYDRWRRALSRIAGKEEWTLHVFAGPHVAPKHSPYLLRVKSTRSRTAAKRLAEPGGPVDEAIAKTWRACTAIATASRHLESSADRRAVFGATLLVPATRIDLLKEAIERQALPARTLGLTYYLEGPRPPFNFV